VTSALVKEVAAQIGRIARERQVVRVAIADAPWSDCRAPELVGAIRTQATIVDELYFVRSRNYRLRFPHFTEPRFRQELTRTADVYYFVVKA
jgi:hypothetical protein